MVIDVGKKFETLSTDRSLRLCTYRLWKHICLVSYILCLFVSYQFTLKNINHLPDKMQRSYFLILPVVLSVGIILCFWPCYFSCRRVYPSNEGTTNHLVQLLVISGSPLVVSHSFTFWSIGTGPQISNPCLPSGIVPVKNSIPQSRGKLL